MPGGLRDGQMKKTKEHWLKMYICLITLCAVLFLAAFAVLFYDGGYGAKVLAKLGLKELPDQSNWAVAGWNNTLYKLDYDADVVFFGDSITHDSDFREFFPEKKIVNCGYPGDDLEGMIERVYSLAKLTPETVFVLGGINGLTDKNVDESIAVYSRLIDTLKENLPDSKIVIQSVLPLSGKREPFICRNSTSLEFNGKLKRLTEEKADINEYLELFTMWFRDVLLFKATAEVDKLVFRRQLDMIKKRASQSSYEGLQEILNAIEKVKTRLKANVNFELSIELLLLTIREN